MGFDSGGLYLGALCRTTSKHVETAYRWSRRGFVLCACAATLPHQCHHHIYNQSYSVCVCVCVCVCGAHRVKKSRWTSEPSSLFGCLLRGLVCYAARQLPCTVLGVLVYAMPLLRHR